MYVVGGRERSRAWAWRRPSVVEKPFCLVPVDGFGDRLPVGFICFFERFEILVNESCRKFSSPPVPPASFS